MFKTRSAFFLDVFPMAAFRSGLLEIYFALAARSSWYGQYVKAQ
jgi:hypothetical protein